MKLTEIYSVLQNGDYGTVSSEIKRLNDLYRKGDTEITDIEYDALLKAFELVDPTNEIFESGVIEEVNSERKDVLKYPMFSLDKEHEVEDILKWLRNKGVPSNTLLVVTAKYDGISVLKNEFSQECWSRGDGTIGETMHDHYKRLGDKAEKINIFSIGEMLIPKPVFASRTYYRENGEAFKNARNMIAGMKNNDRVSSDLQYAKHVRYGFASEDFTKNKTEQLDFISNKLFPVPYKAITADKLTVDELNDLFIEWGKEFDIDGLVIDIDDKDIRKSLGRGRNNNPAYSKAYKNPDWSENANATIIDIEWNISKQGYLKPVGILNPIDLEGVTISRVTLNNAKFVKDNNLGANSEIIIKRSGGVIPKLVDVLNATGFKLPNIIGSVIFWNDNGVELCVNNTEEQEIKKIISFFEILNTDNVSEGVVNQLYKSGYKSIEQILNMSISDFETLEKFGKTKSKKVFTSIKNATTNVKLSKLMHSTGLFNNLGSKKLELLVHFEEKPTIDDIIKIDGFSEKSANYYLDGYNNFYNWLETIHQITIETKKEVTNTNQDLFGLVFVFTGLRLKPEQEILISRGAKIGSGVSKNTTHLVCKDTNSGSSKLVKARTLGVDVIDVDGLYEILNS